MSAPVNGLKTITVKHGQEAFIQRNFGTIDDVGSYLSSAAGSGTYTADADYVFPGAGADLVLRVADQPIFSATDMVVAVEGTAVGGGALEGWATVKANSPEDQAYTVATPASAKFASVTSMSATNGVLGDKVEVLVLPNPANDVEMCYIQDLSLERGKTVKAVYCHFTLMHNKRLRGERNMSATIWYTHHMEGLALITDRDVTLRIDIKDDCKNTITETIYVDKARIGVSWSKPAGDEGEVTSKGDGTFGRLLVFS